MSYYIYRIGNKQDFIKRKIPYFDLDISVENMPVTIYVNANSNGSRDINVKIDGVMLTSLDERPYLSNGNKYVAYMERDGDVIIGVQHNDS